MKRVSFIFILLMTFSGLSNAQTLLTLDDCINIALENNSQVLNAQTNFNNFKSQKLASYSGILPNLSFSAGPGRNYRAPSTFTTYAPVGVDPETGQVVYESTEVTSQSNSTINYFLSFNFSQNIWDQGRWWNRIHQAETNVKAAEFNVDNIKQNTIAQVNVTYYELIKALEQKKVSEESVNLSLEQLKRSETMYRIGTVAQIDIYSSQVNYDRSKISLINQDLVIENAENNLNLAMGREPNTPLNINTNVPLDVNYDLSLEDLTNQALNFSPELRRLDQFVQGAEIGVKISKASRYPTLSYSIGYSRSNSDVDRLYNDITKNYSLNTSISLRINIFDGFQTKRNIQQSQNTMKINEENMESQARTIRANIENYYRQLLAFQKKIDINASMIIAAQEGLRLANERYRVGSGTLIETIDAQVQLTSARYNLLQLQYNALIAQANLRAAAGNN